MSSENPDSSAFSAKNLPVWILIAAGLLLGVRFLMGLTSRPAGASNQAAVGEESLVKWVPISESKALASATGRPLMYDFTAAWCGPCRMLTAQVFNDKESADWINAHFVPVRVMDRQREEGRNPPEIEELQRTYQIDAFPTLIVVKSGGEPQKSRGFMGKDGTMNWLKGM